VFITIALLPYYLFLNTGQTIVLCYLLDILLFLGLSVVAPQLLTPSSSNKFPAVPPQARPVVFQVARLLTPPTAGAFPALPLPDFRLRESTSTYARIRILELDRLREQLINTIDGHLAASDNSLCFAGTRRLGSCCNDRQQAGQRGSRVK
jgi:hypothetical protein